MSQVVFKLKTYLPHRQQPRRLFHCRRCCCADMRQSIPTKFENNSRKFGLLTRTKRLGSTPSDKASTSVRARLPPRARRWSAISYANWAAALDHFNGRENRRWEMDPDSPLGQRRRGFVFVLAVFCPLHLFFFLFPSEASREGEIGNKISRARQREEE